MYCCPWYRYITALETNKAY
uniref:Uncharacterized protein n=1 Tax=Arundo donax TaxID=35708 RepID=A0A0A8YPS2_ARUDO